MAENKSQPLSALGLQQPRFVYMGGEIRPWDTATLHISCEAVTRGLNVFEGLKGYWQSAAPGVFGILEMQRHYNRLARSAKLLHIPVPVTYEEFVSAVTGLVKSLYEPDKDMWVRATLYVVEGHWGEGTVADLVLTAYHQGMAPPQPATVGVSTWRRSSDVSLPARIKTSANYQVARLARIEGRSRGYSEMILLNESGRVAEATGACLLMVRDGNVITPPASEGRLESITIEIIKGICKSLAFPFEERPIERTELLLADEVCLVGTLAELTPVSQVDDYRLPTERPVMDSVAQTFWQAVRGIAPHPSLSLTLF